MNRFASLVLLSAIVAVTVTNVAHGLPAPGKTDAAKIQKNMAKNKGIARVMVGTAVESYICKCRTRQ